MSYLINLCILKGMVPDFFTKGLLVPVIIKTNMDQSTTTATRTTTKQPTIIFKDLIKNSGNTYFGRLRLVRIK